MLEIPLSSPQDTEALGAQLAAVVPEQYVLYLEGDLGAGKTTLVRGLLRASGHTGIVRSPTYTLMESYLVKGRQVVHMDLYRLADPEELEFIGIRDLLEEQTDLLVEWPERGRGLLPAADLSIELRYADSGRLARIEAGSAVGEEIVAKLGASSFFHHDVNNTD